MPSNTFGTSSATVQARIQQYTHGKLEVSNAFYGAMCLVTFLVVACNSVFNGLYGWEQGTTTVGTYLTAIAYTLGDWTLTILVTLIVPLFIARIAGVLSCLGLVALSVFAAAAFLIGQQYQQENYDITALKQSIEDDREAYQQYHKLATAQRIERKQERLSAMLREKGGSGSTAIYHYVADATGHTVEAVSLVVRVSWSAVFVLAAIGLGGYLKRVYCPASVKAYARFVLGVEGAKQAGEAILSSLEAQMGAPAVAYMTAPKDAVPNDVAPTKKTQKPRKKRAPTQDTGTTGSTAQRYEAIRERVQAGTLKPSIAALKRTGMGTATAQTYQQQLLAEGIIKPKGRGFVLA